MMINDCRFGTPVALTGQAEMFGMLFHGLGRWEAEAKLPLLNIVILQRASVLLHQLQVNPTELLCTTGPHLCCSC